VATSIQRDNTQNFLRFLSKQINTGLIKLSGTIAAKSVPVRPNGGCVVAAVNATAFTVSVALVPGVTNAGEILHVGAGDGPLTEHWSEMLLENPLCVPIVSMSLAWPPRLTPIVGEAGLSVKSGAGLNVTVTA